MTSVGFRFWNKFILHSTTYNTFVKKLAVKREEKQVHVDFQEAYASKISTSGLNVHCTA